MVNYSFASALLACVALFQVPSNAAAVVGPLSRNILETVAKNAQRVTSDPATAAGSAGIEIWHSLKSFNTDTILVDCPAILQICTEKSTFEELIACSKSMVAARCEVDGGLGESKAGKAAASNLKQALGGKSLETISDAAFVASVFGSGSAEEFNQAIGIMDELYNARIGAFHAQPGAEASNDLTWKALRAISTLFGNEQVSKESKLKSLAQQVLQGVLTAIDDADDSGEGPLTFGTTSTLKSTGRMLQYYGATSAYGQLDSGLSVELLQRFAEYLIGVVASSYDTLGVDDMSDAISGLVAIDGRVVLTKFTSQPDLIVEATTPLGLPLAKLALLEKITIDKKPATYKRHLLVSEAQSSFILIPNEPLSPGTHVVRFTVASHIGQTKVVRTFTTSSSIKLSDFVVSVTKDTKATGGKDSALAYPKTATISATSKEYLHVSVSVTDAQSGANVVPAQLVVRMEHVATGTESYYPLVQKKKSDKMWLSLSLDNQEALVRNAGKYKLTLFAADKSVDNPIAWDFATLDFTPVDVPEAVGSPLYKRHLLYESDVASSPLPEIHHMFRKPDNRAGFVTAAGFAAALIAAFVAFVGLLFYAGGNLKGFSFSVWNLASLVLLGGILALYVEFWIELSLINTLYLLGPAYTLLVFVGHAALQSRHESLKKAVAKQSKKD